MEIINGLCVSLGNAQGTVRVINKSKHSSENLPNNTILVMKFLDRGLLTEINKNVVGVIAEHGNIGSHGSGILRQLGIPCILRVNNATEIFEDGDIVKIYGQDNYIKCVHCKKLFQQSSSIRLSYRYELISKPGFSLSDIRVNADWVCLRPKRHYQKLRFDMISESFAQSPSYLYNTPIAKTKQNEFGAVIVSGAPDMSDICSYVLQNPDWYLSKAKERSEVIASIKEDLYRLKSFTNDALIENIQVVFYAGIKLYRRLFQYSFLSQFISDELIEIYLDFLRHLLGHYHTRDILGLTSDYVKNSLKDDIALGDAQKWNRSTCFPHVWQGTIDYSVLQIDPVVTEAIQLHVDSHRLREDYNSFRVIIPLAYQLSEEFFYISSSINSFINWAIVNLHQYLFYRRIIDIEIDKFYELPLCNVIKMIEDEIAQPGMKLSANQ